MLASPIYHQSPPPTSKSVSQNPNTCRGSPNLSDVNRKRSQLNKIKDPFHFKRFKISSNGFSSNSQSSSSSNSDDGLLSFENTNPNMNENNQSSAKSNCKINQISAKQSKSTNSGQAAASSLQNSPMALQPNRHFAVAARSNKNSSAQNISSNLHFKLNLSKKLNRKRALNDEMDIDSNIALKRVIKPYQHTAITTSGMGGMYDDEMRETESDIGVEKSLDDASSTTLGNLTTSSLKSTLESKLRYYKRLKQLPSQIAKENQKSKPSTSNFSLNSNLSTSNTTTNPTKKITIDDAVHILEKILLEQEDKLKEEFNEELHKRLNDQYETFIRYNEEYVRGSGNNYDCSYLS